MIKIRLARLGRKKRPFYRVVATNSRSPRDGKFLEILGTYDPLQEPSLVKIDKERLDEWVKKGAQLSNRVQQLTDPEKYAELVKHKPKRKPKKAQVEEKEVANDQSSNDEPQEGEPEENQKLEANEENAEAPIQNEEAPKEAEAETEEKPS